MICSKIWPHIDHLNKQHSSDFYIYSDRRLNIKMFRIRCCFNWEGYDDSFRTLSKQLHRFPLCDIFINKGETIYNVFQTLFHQNANWFWKSFHYYVPTVIENFIFCHSKQYIFHFAGYVTLFSRTHLSNS